MSIYSAKYRLTSCKVNLKLIRELEKFILTETKEYLLTSGKENTDYEPELKGMYNLSLQAKGETVKYTSIEEYKDEKLPDGTNSVILELSSVAEKFIHLKVIFHSSISEHPVLEITMADTHAKETCKPIAEGIIKIVKGHRNVNFLFHNRFVQIGLLLLYAAYNVLNYYILCSPVFDPGPLILAYSIIISFTLGIFTLWYIVSIFMRQYTSFDTGREKIISIGYYLISALFILVIAYYLYSVFARMHP